VRRSGPRDALLETHSAPCAPSAARRSRFLWFPLAWAALLPATPAAAQFGIYDSLARSFSDVSFSANIGGLAGSAGSLTAERLTHFGIEVLLGIGTVSRVTGPAEPGDTVALRWREMRVVQSGDGTDTINTYDVVRLTHPVPSVPVWAFEIGVGYGQTSGYETSLPGLRLAGGIRDLPALSLYASYVPTGSYIAVRSGYMRFHGLQLFDEQGETWTGDAESFMAGGAIGQVMTLLNIDFFAEAGYSARSFPSVRWSGPTRGDLPRSISAHNWSVGVGVQFGIGGN
jgi:hypothetical protein